MSTITAPLKWFGGKHYLARRIIDLMPRHLHYVEPFFGGGAVLFAREPDDDRLWLSPHKGVSEVVNDINGDLINFWRVLKAPDLFEEFRRTVEAIPVSRLEWEEALPIPNAVLPRNIANAVNFFIRCRQSRAGMMRDFTSVTRSRTRRQMNGNVSEWLGAVDGLPDVHARLRRVLIENMPAVALIKREDTPGTLFYLDPPYLHSTRSTTDGYAHEMTEADHVELLEVICGVEGKVILSGYHSEWYHDTLRGWRTVEFDLPNNAAGGKAKAREIEVLWMNFAADGGLD